MDYSLEPTTLVEFMLEEVNGGTSLTIVESGFDRIRLARRAEAFRMNDNGWTGQIKSIELETKRLEKARRALDQISADWDQAIGRLKAFVEDDREDRTSR
ncbi:MAG TPA: hypothetical protein VK575_09620 [Gemmatimonadaceae bacterium]|nr:hypothetical protein [Gemmatimonadaceae bacterium]